MTVLSQSQKDFLAQRDKEAQENLEAQNAMLLEFIRDPKNPIRSYADLVKRYDALCQANEKRMRPELPEDPRDLLALYNQTRDELRQARYNLKVADAVMENLRTENPEDLCQALSNKDDAVEYLDLKQTQVERIIAKFRETYDSFAPRD